MGKSKLLAFVDADNTASRKVQEKAGSVITHTGFRFRILILWDIFRLQPVCQESLKALKEETDGIRG
jgi:RimJ/RimL family protein N-acetyltransferase